MTKNERLYFDGQDDYEEYSNETRGYRYDTWDSLTQGEIDSHDRFLHRTVQELEATPANAGTTLERWALSRAWLANGRTKNCLSAIRGLLEEESLHPVLDRDEIALLAAELSLTLRDFSSANSFLEEIATDHPCAQIKSILLTAGSVLQGSDDAHDALEKLRSDGSEDPEFCFDVAALFFQFELTELGRAWLQITREIANSTGKLAVLVDLELLEAEQSLLQPTEE